MNVIGPAGDEARREAAADWIVRLCAADLHEDDVVAFDAWLADPDNTEAYDAALAVWNEYDLNAPAVAEGLSSRPAVRPARRGLFLGFGAAAAAAAVAAVLVGPQLARGPETQVYATAKGQHRSITLSDGSLVDLNAGTRLSVTMARDARRVTLDEGEAVFDVAHNGRKPFEIAAGDRMIRVVGTQFDVRRRDGQLSVAVTRGAVEVRPAGGRSGPGFRLHPGQRVELTEGSTAVKMSAATPEEALAWRTGRLVYKGQPLSRVVADLNQQFPTPIRIEDPQLAAAPVSGVFVLDDQDAVIRRLALLLPIQAVPSPEGLVLRREGASRR